MAQAFRTQNLRLLGNLFDKNNSLGAKGYSLYSTADGTAWQADQNDTSGILVGGILSIGSGSNTISITAGNGQIFTRALVGSEIVTTLTNVSWSAFTNVSLTYLATKQFSYLYIDNTGALIQSDTVFSDSTFKNYIVVGIVVHLNNTLINAVINAQNAGYGDSHRLYELYSTFGPIKRSGLSISSNGANLKINRAAGSVLLIGCNYTTDQFEPDSATVTAYVDTKFARVRGNGSGGHTFDNNSGTLYSAINPDSYDNGSGTLASVTAGYWTIQRFYFFPSQQDRLVNYYGIATYATLADALIALPTENFSESSFTSRDAVFLGYVIVKQGVTDLSSSSNAKFLQAGLSRSLSSSSASGGGVSAITALDDLTDVQIATPSGGQFLTYDSTTSLWKNRSYILDANNNELIKFPSTVASAVNELTISNAATGVSPSISATGDNADISLNLISKGTGLIQINGKAISLANSFTTSGNFALTFTTTASTSLTLPTSGTLATTSQIPIVNNNILTLAGSGGIGVGTSPTFTANASADKTITISIADAALTILKLENIATSSILGRTTGSSGPVEILGGSGVVSVIGTNAVARATNLAAGIAGQIPYQSGANATAFSAAGTTNQVLLSGGAGAPTWANQSSLSVGSATTAGSVTNALTISSPLTGTSYNGSAAVSIGLQDASATLAGGVSIGAQTFAGNKTFKDSVIISGDLTVNGSTITINSSTLSVDDKNIELGAVIAIASLSSTSDITATSNIVNVASTSGLIVGQALTKTTGTGAFGTNPIIASIVSSTQFTVTPVHATSGSIVFSVGGATDITADTGGITLKGATDKTFNWLNATSSWTSSENLDIAAGKTYKINNVAVLSSTTLGSSVVNSSLTSVGTLTNLTVTNTINGSVSGSAGSLSASYTFWGQTFNGTQNVSGSLTSVGNITGTGGITITAGGSNQNVVLTPSGTGYTLLNGSVGIGNSTPNNKLTIQAGDNKDSGPIINLGGNAINQFESGRIRFTEVATGATPFYQGAYLHYDASNNLFHIGVHDASDSLTASDTNAVSIVRSSANIGIGTTNPLTKLHAIGQVYIDNYTNLTAKNILTLNMNGANYAHIYDTGLAGNVMAIGGSSNVSTLPSASIMSWDLDDARVGVGTVTPAYKLDVNGNAGFTNGITVNIDSTSSSYFVGSNGSRPIIFQNNTAAAYDFGFKFTDSNTFTLVGGNTLANPTTDLVSFKFDGNVDIGTTIPTAKLDIKGGGLSVSGFSNNNSGTAGGIEIGWDGSQGIFQVYDRVNSVYKPSYFNASYQMFYISGVEKARLASNGCLGIGTTGPGSLLHLYGSGEVVQRIESVGSRAYGFVVNPFWRANSFSIYDFTGDGARILINSAGKINIGGGASDPANLLTLFGGVSIGSGYNTAGPANGLIVEGSVGIGTTAPSGKLQVFGTANAIELKQSAVGSATYYVMDNTVETGGRRYRFGYSGASADKGSFTIYNQTDNIVPFTITTSGNIGAGTITPDLKFHIDGSNAYPATTGTTANGFLILRAKSASATHGMYLGVADASPFGSWIQCSDSANLATNYPLLLNPNGGNVGVGITSPGEKLEVNGNIKLTTGGYIYGDTTAPYLRLNQANGTYLAYSTTSVLALLGSITTLSAGSNYLGLITNGFERMRINSNGYVGIGTTAFVYGAANRGLLEVYGSSDALIALRNTTANFYIQKSGNNFAMVNEGAGYMAFNTNGSDRLFINSSGDIGIGTTNPTAKLQVIAGNSPAISILSNNVGQYAYQYIGRTASELELGIAGSANHFFIGTVAGDAVIKQNSTGKLHLGYGSAAPSITINSSSNVGIGTINPIFKFQVVGSAYVNNGTLYIDSGNSLTWGNSTQYILGNNDVGLSFAAGSATRMFVSSSGNIGLELLFLPRNYM